MLMLACTTWCRHVAKNKIIIIIIIIIIMLIIIIIIIIIIITIIILIITTLLINFLKIIMNFYNTQIKNDAKKLQSIICLKIVMYENSF